MTTHNVPRHQKTPLPGERPGVLKDPAPQGAVTGGYVAAPGPLLSTPSFADSMADSVDDRAVQILLQLALKKKKEEEDEEERRRAEEEKHEKRMQLLNQKVGQDMPLTKAEWAAWRQWVVKLPSLPSSSAGTKRKRKKRRKKKTPKSSSFQSSFGVRPRRCGQGSRSRSSSSGGCGRLCVHARQVPAVAGLQWKLLPSISPTQWWTFQLCYGDRYGCVQVQFLDKVVFLPGIVLRQIPMVLPVQNTIEAPQLQFARWSMPLLCRSCHAR